jgi:hypothetical protein
MHAIACPMVCNRGQNYSLAYMLTHANNNANTPTIFTTPQWAGDSPTCSHIGGSINGLPEHNFTPN